MVQVKQYGVVQNEYMLWDMNFLFAVGVGDVRESMYYSKF